MTPEKCIQKIIAKARYILRTKAPEIQRVFDPANWRQLPQTPSSAPKFACDKGTSGTHVWTAEVHLADDKASKISIWTPDGEELSLDP